MNKNTEVRIRRTLACVVEMLVKGEYSELEALSNGVRLQAEHIKLSIDDYGKTLIQPPDEAYDEIDVVQIDGKTPFDYSIRFRLFTHEEGRSDLELQATFVDDDPTAELMRVEIDDLLVA